MTRTHTTQTAGEAGLIELDIDFPDVCTQGIAFLAHPITTHGGSKDLKVITTMAKALVSGGWLVVRPNCRGAGRSEGEYNAGPGEAADFLRVIDAVFEMREVAEALPVGGRAVFGGFSFGTYVMSLAAQVRKPAAMILSLPCRKDMTRLLAKEAQRFPVVSARGFPLPEHCPSRLSRFRRTRAKR